MRIAASQRSEEAARPLPRRLQRSRRKGAKTPLGVRYCGRPTIFGNPFRLDRFGHARSVALHRRWFDGRLGDLTLERLGFGPAEIDALHRLRLHVHAALHQLRGRDLQCWCPVNSRWCHVDTLIARANEPLPPVLMERAA